MDLIPEVHSDWKAPYHLSRWIALLERSIRGNVRAICAIPFQHYKTSTTLMGVVWLLLRDPKIRIILLTHSKAKAIAMGKDLRKYWKAAGGTTEKGFDTLEDWQTPEGGGCVVMSAEQSKLGYPCDLLLVDDPLDETVYMNRDVRDTVDKTISLYTARCATHLNSVLIVASRWHPDDPVGRRLARKAVVWEQECYAGIEGFTEAPLGVNLLEHLESTGAKAFAPDVLSLAQHVQMRNEWTERDPSAKEWYAQVQNDPKPDILGNFGKPLRGPPPVYGRYVIGVDLAYSEKAHSDYFAMLVLKVWEGKGYPCNVVRERRSLEGAARHLLNARRLYPGAPVFSYISGPEKGAINYLVDCGIPIEGMIARTPKYNRAQHTMDAWNLGRIILPEQAPWVDGFIARAMLFTGNESSGDDDEVDALVSACDAGLFSAGFAAKAFGKPRI
jgi:hypothetical protein